jgi:CheY-like chemotaxis protein
MSKKGKILIVDDDPLNLEALQQTFKDDYDVLAAESGPQGLEVLGKNPDTDAVVLDIRMARMDGLETARHIGDPRCAHGHGLVMLRRTRFQRLQ